ncbi:uncharacterized protein BO66DRAFT_196876 [Aspergillus aculeatinus CBS 121060]|uniref:Uncharacterized protein n=1 Tax=Aspergillus aculeatinus CBS 121060 TaxID=1448322 RepID=A0ACD1GWQ8_9EURO|nr:hypothetical protein BO66DRAFT_196876 [Aspergillus aculeatinus CBS 121060]RAH65769.1 hypothetical protein BO66DRAFT_196876 [Aspergillus aculeatinus CBS 121060]
MPFKMHHYHHNHSITTSWTNTTRTVLPSAEKCGVKTNRQPLTECWLISVINRNPNKLRAIPRQNHGIQSRIPPIRKTSGDDQGIRILSRLHRMSIVFHILQIQWGPITSKRIKYVQYTKQPTHHEYSWEVRKQQPTSAVQWLAAIRRIKGTNTPGHSHANPSNAATLQWNSSDRRKTKRKKRREKTKQNHVLRQQSRNIR